MEQESEPSFFDLGDNTALVCVDHQQYQKIVVPQLIDMTYKVHLGLFVEDVLLKMRTYNYNVVVIHENFKGSTLQTNPLLAEMVRQADAQRNREQRQIDQILIAIGDGPGGQHAGSRSRGAVVAFARSILYDGRHNTDFWRTLTWT